MRAARYATLTEAETKRLVVHGKRLLQLERAVDAEVFGLEGELAGRVAKLIDRYHAPTPVLVEARDAATARLKKYFRAIGSGAWA